MPTAASGDDLRLLISGKLEEQGREPMNIQVELKEVEGGVHLSLQDEDGEFLEAPPHSEETLGAATGEEGGEEGGSSESDPKGRITVGPEEEQLHQLLTDHHQAFSLDEFDRGETDLLEMQINTADSPPVKRPPLHPIPVQRPFQVVGVDIMELPLTEAGNKYVLVFQDYLTKWPMVYPMPDQKSERIAKIIVQELLPFFGVPEALLSDRGTNLLSHLMLDLCELLG